VKVAIEQRPKRLALTRACATLELNRSSVYQRRAGLIGTHANSRCRKTAPQPRALTTPERVEVTRTLRSTPYCDQPPAEVYQRLLEQGTVLCSVSTMHRLLRQEGENGERRHQRPAQHHAVPRLTAHQPNDVWTWDITKLPLTTRGIYLSLYAVTDLFSRFIVAWMVSLKENSTLATQLMNEAVRRYAIEPAQLTLHQDRGSPMTAHGYLDDMKQLDITCSHSRPRVSNDNPFSESGFKTLKYQPDYPGKFDTLVHARDWCAQYYHWYNFEHHHSGLSGYTPEQVYTGRYRDIADLKQAALDRRYASNPERFVHGSPRVKRPPQSVSINPLNVDQISQGMSDAVNFPTLVAAGYKPNAS
jgi:putative transposase